MERVKHCLEGVRLKATTSEQSPTVPTYTGPSVETDATPLDSYTTVYADALSDEIASQPDAAQQYKQLENINPKTGQNHEFDFPIDYSAPVLNISLGENNKLTYEDATPGLSDTERSLLGAVQANAPLLESTMRSSRLNEFRFRIFEPTSYAPEQDEMSFLPHDYTDGGKPNIYYFLPPSGALDLEAITAMGRHEALHSALDHNNNLQLAETQRNRFQKACDTLRADALQEMQAWSSDIWMSLYDLWSIAPAKLKPAYETVMNAMDSGTYGELPAHLTPGEVAECYIQPPFAAVIKQAELAGHGELMEAERSKPAVMEQLGNITSPWNDRLEDWTVYKYLKEATWLPTSLENKAKGHPQDGVTELSASSFNRLIGDSEQFGEDIALLRPELQAAVIEVLDLQGELLKEKYPKAKNLLDWQAAHRKIFNKALAN